MVYRQYTAVRISYASFTELILRTSYNLEAVVFVSTKRHKGPLGLLTKYNYNVPGILDTGIIPVLYTAMYVLSLIHI